ncbi:MAG: glycosyltransferase [Gammaproteobacteria bacterium]|nr:glycosyltransferase [Gammaproteobacteria bacterium]
MRSVSVVIPAYNESKLIEGCLRSIEAAFEGAGVPATAREIIVVDNASSDDTAERARALGARVVHEPRRQISRARNAGARVAQGEWLLFIDADSWPDAELIGDLLQVMSDPGVAGGGTVMRMEPLPLSMRFLVGCWNLCSRWLRWAAGAFIFCRRDAFEAVNGFDTALYCGEEINFSGKLKRYARWRRMSFVILSRNPLRTSARKGELYTVGEMFRAFFRLVRHPRRYFRDPALCDVWYDGRR